MIRHRQVCVTAVLGLICCVGADAVPFQVVTVDGSGAPFPDVLVIVRSLEGFGESFRALTNRTGTVRGHELSPGLYQLIATCPYGICETAVREFMVDSDAVDLELPLKIVPTSGNGATIGRLERRQVEVRDTDGKPLASAQVLVRDAAAGSHEWYQTGVDGMVTIRLPPGDEIAVIAIHHGRLARRVVRPDAPKARKEVIAISF